MKMRAAIPGSECAGRIVARGNAIDAAQGRRPRRIEIVEPYRVAVDSRVVVAGHIDRRGDILGQGTPKRLPQRHPLDARDRHHALEDHGAGGVDAQEVAAEREAIV